MKLVASERISGTGGTHQIGEIVDRAFGRGVLGERSRTILTLGWREVVVPRSSFPGLVSAQEDRDEDDVRNEDDQRGPIACEVSRDRRAYAPESVRAADTRRESESPLRRLLTHRVWPTLRQRSSSWLRLPTGRRSRPRPARQRSVPTFVQTCPSLNAVSFSPSTRRERGGMTSPPKVDRSRLQRERLLVALDCEGEGPYQRTV